MPYNNSGLINQFTAHHNASTITSAGGIAASAITSTQSNFFEYELIELDGRILKTIQEGNLKAKTGDKVRILHYSKLPQIQKIKGFPSEVKINTQDNLSGGKIWSRHPDSNINEHFNR